eukprot:TRINITY_DN72516_c0_g1_i1.p1 TRINITY_DN72516_c0_g1~~TRINITY_DN72516_c0_g1_i1.p1  ORF type:complete len:606 (-),score=79.08 TRINITY_DN72516_c0_g1_i1:111-1850(-)
MDGANGFAPSSGPPSHPMPPFLPRQQLVGASATGDAWHMTVDTVTTFMVWMPRPPRTPRRSQAEVEAVGRSWKLGDKDEAADDGKMALAAGTCGICMDDLVPGEDLTRLPCSADGCPSVWHSACIRKWISQSFKPSCPLCRVQAGSFESDAENVGPANSMAFMVLPPQHGRTRPDMIHNVPYTGRRRIPLPAGMPPHVAGAHLRAAGVRGAILENGAVVLTDGGRFGNVVWSVIQRQTGGDASDRIPEPMPGSMRAGSGRESGAAGGYNSRRFWVASPPADAVPTPVLGARRQQQQAQQQRHHSEHSQHLEQPQRAAPQQQHHSYEMPRQQRQQHNQQRGSAWAQSTWPPHWQSHANGGGRGGSRYGRGGNRGGGYYGSGAGASFGSHAGGGSAASSTLRNGYASHSSASMGGSAGDGSNASWWSEEAGSGFDGGYRGYREEEFSQWHDRPSRSSRDYWEAEADANSARGYDGGYPCSWRPAGASSSQRWRSAQYDGSADDRSWSQRWDDAPEAPVASPAAREAGADHWHDQGYNSWSSQGYGYGNSRRGSSWHQPAWTSAYSGPAANGVAARAGYSDS